MKLTTFNLSENDSAKLKKVNYILSLLIVWHHAYNVDVYGLTDYSNVFSSTLIVVEKFISIAGLIAVPLFLLISGFMFFRNYSYAKIWTKYVSRIRSLVIPYIAWNTLVFIFFFCLTNIPRLAVYMNMPKVSLSLNSIYRNIIWSDLNYSMWYVRVLIGIVMLTPLLYWLIRGNARGIVSILIVILLYIIYPIGQHTLLFCLPFFMIGGFIAIHCPRVIFRKMANNKWIVCVIIYVLVTIAYVLLEVFDYGRLRQLFLIAYIIPAWIAIRDACWVRSDTSVRWNVTISFFIYCMHGVVLESVEKILLITIGKSIAGAWIDFIFAPMFTIVIVTAVAWLLKKYLPFVWGLLNGRRT